MLRYGRFSQTAGMGVVHSDETEGPDRENSERKEMEAKRRPMVIFDHRAVLSFIHVAAARILLSIPCEQHN